MQEENNISSHFFSQRTERLAAVMGVNIQDLPDIIGVSRRMLFGYRSGSHQVSAKALAKLEAAEEKAGIKKIRYDDLKGELEMIMEPGHVYGSGGGGAPKYLEERVADLESKYVKILEMFSEIRNGQKKILRASETKQKKGVDDEDE